MSIENCGHAAPMLAEYILNNGGAKYFFDVYNKYKNLLIAETTASYNSTRFIETFSARFLATAQIASSALGINFDIEGIKKYLLDYEKENANKRNTSAESYDIIIEECKKNSHKFVHRHGKGEQTKSIPSASVTWGRLTPHHYKVDDRTVLEEIEIYPSVVEEILKNNGFNNVDTCIKAWKESGVLSFETGRNHHRRCIDPTSKVKSKVFVFRVFDDVVENSKNKGKEESKLCPSTQLKKLQKS